MTINNILNLIKTEKSIIIWYDKNSKFAKITNNKNKFNLFIQDKLIYFVSQDKQNLTFRELEKLIFHFLENEKINGVFSQDKAFLKTSTFSKIENDIKNHKGFDFEIQYKKLSYKLRNNLKSDEYSLLTLNNSEFQDLKFFNNKQEVIDFLKTEFKNKKITFINF